MKNYFQTEKKVFPIVYSSKETKKIFLYVDKIEFKQREVLINFWCDKYGRPIGEVNNTYFI